MRRRDILKLGAGLAGTGLALGAAPASVSAATYSIDSDLTEPANVTGEELDAALQETSPGSPLVGLGDTFVAVQDSEGINAIYMAAHAAWESAWGRSTIAQTKNNLYGWRAYDSCPGSCSASFASFAACVRYVMPRIKDLYLVSGGAYYTSDGPTLRGMNRNYATDPNWAEGIAGVMNSIADNLDVTQPPSLAVGQDVVTTGEVNVRNGPGTSYDVIDTRKDGDAGTVVDGSTEADGYIWWEVEYSDGTTGWSVQRYLDENTRDGTRFEIDERVETTAELSVRTGPGTNYDRTEVTGVGDAGYVRDGPVEADGYTWYKVGYNAGYEGWSAGGYMEAAPLDRPGRFDDDQRVATTSDLNVRDAPGTDSDVIATASEGDAGYVRKGPTTEDTYTWWKVEYNNGNFGWSAESWLEPAPVDSDLAVGQRVAAVEEAWLFEQPDADSEGIGTVAAGDAGYINDGPVDEDGYTWWQADFNGGLSGWITAANVEPEPISDVDPAFDIGQDVATTADLNVREGPGTDYGKLDLAPNGTGGTVVNGFATADGYTWWKVDFEGSVSTGWVVETYLGNEASAAFDYPLGGEITSDWYDVRSYGYHSSLDIASPKGDEIVAARAGSVSNVVYLDAGGKSVYVDHGDGYVTKYMHLSEYAVSEGDAVDRGEVIGYVGETGRATGPHLHFELELDGENQFIPGERGEVVALGDPIPETYTGI